MTVPPDDNHYVRRVVLPSGRSIEVVYFESAPPAAPSTGDRELHVCPACDGGLVQPVDWEEHDDVRWLVSLHCPSCEWSEIELFSQPAVDRFDEELDRGTEALVRDLRRLTRANMEDEIDRFVHALHSDALLPEDF